MAKAILKIQKTEVSVPEFLNSLKDEQQRNDSFSILNMMQEVTGEEPKIWGAAIIGFGSVLLKYESGRELDWFTIGFSPRKQAITIYGIINTKTQRELLKKLGKHTTGKGCLYIKKLTDIDSTVLKKMIESKIK